MCSTRPFLHVGTPPPNRNDIKFYEFSIENGAKVISEINGSLRYHLDSSQFYVEQDGFDH